MREDALGVATRLAAPRLREKRVVLDPFLRSAGLSVSQINKKDAVLPFGSGNRVSFKCRYVVEAIEA